MLKSKHTIAALIIAPLLSIGGYFLVDAIVGEKPQVAEKGQSYPLVALPNCRYSSGKCTLKNNDFKIELTAGDESDSGLNLVLSTAMSLQAVKVAMVTSTEQEGAPLNMQASDDQHREWQVTLPAPQPDSQLRLVVVADGSFYFGETGLAFVNYDTAYHQDFRTQ